MIYTIGYSGWTLQDMRHVIGEREAVLVDIRLTPRSRWVPCWRQPALKVTFGDAYAWIRELGNLAYNERPRRIEIADLDAGLARLAAIVAAVPNVVLLCGCPALEACHRLDVAQAIEARWRVPVEHLQAPARARRATSTQATNGGA
jgi:uncharacterized protein (DUF488 family)